MKLKKILILGLGLGLVLFTGCIGHVSTGEDNKPGNTVTTDYSKDINPTVSSTASVSQDFIFNTDSVGFTTVTIRRSEWNKMLSYYDYFYKNENNVIAESYEYEKDGKKWKLNNVGLRLRGNTSRFRPQGKDSPTDETGHRMPNADWSSDYYNYAANCTDDDYRQSHFKVDFEPLDSDDRKLSGCMKGVALKRSDNLFSSEIFCYYLFHQYGIWTAPRASQTKVYIKFIEDINTDGTAKNDISNCKVTNVDFGVYEMFEEVNKQSLKGRMAKKGNNSATNAWANNEGDLWKCSGGDLTAGSNQPSNFGCEKVEILNTDKPKTDWDFVWYRPCYDLKTNKSSIDAATAKFQGFLTELNNLSNYEKFTELGKQARIDFYEKWFDVDFFIKTYAVNMLVGMDDDYWGNANNYYLYFDNGKNGSGKCYFIPFDYDNTLGKSITGDKVYTHPFEWGNGNNRPLLDRLLEVPEYETKLKNALLEVSSQEPDSPWNKDKCIEVWNKWRNQISPYTYSDDIRGWPNISSLNWEDNGGWKNEKHYLAQDANNIYEQVYLNFKKYLSGAALNINFDLNDGIYNGQSETVTAEYNGIKSKFEDIIGTPTRPGYAFLGWTKTRNGTDYTETYKGEDNLTVYASWLDISTASGLTIYEIEDSTYAGIKVYIANLPENHYRRNFYINNREVCGDSCDNPGRYRNIWAYPFTDIGSTYEIKVTYKNEGYSTLETSNTIAVTAKSGLGEFKVINSPEYYFENNILKWKREPVIQIGNGKGPRSDGNWEEYYLFEIQSTKVKDSSAPNGYKGNWNYISWNYMGATCNNNFNIMEHLSDNSANVLNGNYYDLCFRLSYKYNTPYSELYMILYDYNKVEYFNIQ